MAGEGDAERLVVLLEARIKDFERNMAKASGTATKSYAGMKRDSASATAKMEADMIRSTSSINRVLAATSARVGGFGKSMAMGFAAPLVGLLSLTAAINGAKAALDEFGAISDNAKSSGLDPELFQGLAYGAQQAGVEFDAFSGALDTFAKNSGLAVEGKGRMVTALKALNPELLANIQAATTQEQRVRLAADAIEKTTDASKRAALATALFGDAGFKMADAFSDGAAGIDRTVAAARDLGLIVDRDLIARAEAMGDEFDTATKVMDLQFKRALIGLAPILISTAQLAGNLAAAINYMVQSMQSLQDRSTARLEEDYNAITATLDQANATYAPGVTGNMGVQMDPEKQAQMQAEADAMRAELKRRAMQQLAVDLNKPKPVDDFGGGGGGRNAAADAALKQGEAVKTLIANLQHEQDQLGRTADEQELYNALKSVGVTADSEFGQAIAATMGPLQQQRAAIEANQQAMEAFQGLASDALKGFISDLREGESFTDALGDTFGRLADQLLQMAADQAIKSLFSNLFGAAFGGSAGSAGGITTTLKI